MQKYGPVVARILLGFVFFASGLVGLTGLVKPPDDLPEKLKAFNAGMEASVYLFPLVKATETVCGLLLLTGQFVPLALIVLAPVIINIFMVHLFLAPEGLVLAVILGLLEIYLAFFATPYKQVVRQIFVRKP